MGVLWYGAGLRARVDRAAIDGASGRTSAEGCSADRVRAARRALAATACRVGHRRSDRSRCFGQDAAGREKSPDGGGRSGGCTGPSDNHKWRRPRVLQLECIGQGDRQRVVAGAGGSRVQQARWRGHRRSVGDADRCFDDGRCTTFRACPCVAAGIALATGCSRSSSARRRCGPRLDQFRESMRDLWS